MARRRGRRGGQNSGRIDLNRVANSAVREGIKALTDSHPMFRGLGGYIASNIDQDALREKIEDAYTFVSQSKVPQDQKIAYLRKEIANYVASGEVLNDGAKEVVLNRGLEAKARQGGWKNFLGRRVAKSQLEGVRYLEETIDTFSQIYGVLASGELHGPEVTALAEEARDIKDIGSLYAIGRIMHNKGILNDRDYNAWHTGIVRGVKERRVRFKTQYEEVTAQKLAASIMATLGLIFIAFFGFSMTGNVVGDATTSLEDIFGIGVGVVFIILSLMSFSRIRKLKKLFKFKRRK